MKLIQRALGLSLLVMSSATAFVTNGMCSLRCRQTPRSWRSALSIGDTWVTLEHALAKAEEAAVTAALNTLKEEGSVKLFNSTNLFYQRYTLAEMKIATGLRGDIIDKLGLNGRRDLDTLGSLVFGVGLASFISSTAVIQTLPGPDIVRYTVSLLISFIPYAFLTLGIAKPEALQIAIVNFFRLTSREYSQRLIQHEAGHFLLGYLCGLPIAAYSANSVTNAVQFFPGRGQGSLGWTISEEQLLKLGIVSLGGIVSECRGFGNSEGGYADLMQLQTFLQRSETKLSNREQQDRVRFAAVMAHTYLNTHLDAFDALCDAFARRASIVECIHAIESSADAK